MTATGSHHLQSLPSGLFQARITTVATICGQKYKEKQSIFFTLKYHQTRDLVMTKRGIKILLYPDRQSLTSVMKCTAAVSLPTECTGKGSIAVTSL